MNPLKDINGVTYVTDEYFEQAMRKERRNCFWAGAVMGIIIGIIVMLFGYYCIVLARL